MHSFTGTAETAAECVELGLYISFAGMVTFKKSDALRAVAATFRPDRILVETDSPYLSPQPLRGKRNEPANLVHTAACLAEVRGAERGRLRRSNHGQRPRSLFRFVLAHLSAAAPSARARAHLTFCADCGTITPGRARPFPGFASRRRSYAAQTARLRMVATADAKRHATQCATPAEGGLSRRSLRPRVQDAAGIAGGHDPLGPVYRHAGEHRHQGPVSQVSRRAAAFAAAPSWPSWSGRFKAPGFFRNKAKNIKSAAADAGREVRRPGAAQIWTRWWNCRGVGRKTANVVLGTAFGIASRRGGRYARHAAQPAAGPDPQNDAVKIEHDLMDQLPKREWIDFSHRMIHHGRQICLARKPQVRRCSAGRSLSENRSGGSIRCRLTSPLSLLRCERP